MTKFNKGDKVRYKTVRGYESYDGLEGEVVAHREGYTNILVTKGVEGREAGRVYRLISENLELVPVPVPEPEAVLATGDRVRINGQTPSGWGGVEGVLVGFSELDYAAMRITSQPPSGWIIGNVVNFKRHVYDVIASAEVLPREVELSEVRVGDTVRVTYPTVESSHGTVKTSRIDTREGVVRTIRDDGQNLYSLDDLLINSYLGGRDKAVYTLLERPVPKPVRKMATEPVGSQFKTTVDVVGLRLLTKVAEDKWTDFFLKSGHVYEADDRQAQEAFDGRGGEWLKV